MKIKAAVCYEYKTPLVVEEIDLADPRKEEVLIKMVGSGVCHTDIHAQEDGWGGMDKMPMVFGHEGSGIVEKVGPGVTEFKPGDHVIVSYPYCGECEYCLTGKPYLCPECISLIHGGTMADGFSPLSKDGKTIHNFFGSSTYATHAVANVRNLAKVDPDVDLSLLGPLACGFMTGSGAVLGQFKAEPGSTIAVFGLGGVGISALMAAKICNCTTIIAVDIVESRLELAKELGATHTINGKQIEDVVGEIKKITGGKGVDYAVEATGFEPVVRNAIHSMGMGSEIAIIGPATHFEFEQLWGELYGKTIRVINMGMVQPKLFIPKLVEWYKKGMFPIDKICKTYTLDDINVAFEDSLNGTSIKPIIKFE